MVAEIVVVGSAASMADRYPEFAPLAGPFVLAAIVFGCCLEAVLVITALLIRAIRSGRIFGTTASTLVDALVAALAVATVIVLAVLPAVPGPPALGLGLLGAALSGTAVVLVVLVLRSLLRTAASMRRELDAVV